MSESEKHPESITSDNLALNRRKPIRVPTKAFLNTALAKRQLDRIQEGSETHVIIRPMAEGQLEIDRADFNKMHGRSLAEDPFLIERLEESKSHVLSRLHSDGDRPDMISELVALRIWQCAEAMGRRIDPEASIRVQAEEFLTKLTVEEYEHFLRIHIASEERRSRDFSQKSDQSRSELILRLSVAAGSGKLPNSFDLEKAKVRIINTEFRPELDVLWFSGGGAYDSEMHSIRTFDLDINDEQTEIPSLQSAIEISSGILMHEAMHSLSGQGIVQSSQAKDRFEYDPPMRLVKNGLAFGFSEEIEKTTPKGERIYARFRWLNEAVTEKLAIKLVNKNEPNAREPEIRGYELLKSKARVDLPDELFEEAYFEDFDTTAPAGEGLPKWRELRQRINQAYDPRFLIELDEFIRAYKNEGLARAIEFMESLEKGAYGAKHKPLQTIRAEKAGVLGLSLKATWKEIADAESPQPHEQESEA